MLPLGVIELAPRGLVVQKQVGAAQPRIGEYVTHNGIGRSHRLRCQRDRNVTFLIKQQTNAKPLGLAGRDGVAYGLAHPRLIKVETKISSRRLQPLQMARQ